MPSEPHLYDLVLLLKTSSDEAARAKVRADIDASIAAAGGSVERNQEWGQRPTAYQIDHQGEAEYHLLQFMGPPSLLEELQHNLGISDDVLRFRIIKVKHGTPPAPDTAPPVVVGSAGVSVGNDDE
jgi:small subunit ribosomal protein S6